MVHGYYISRVCPTLDEKLNGYLTTWIEGTIFRNFVSTFDESGYKMMKFG